MHCRTLVKILLLAAFGLSCSGNTAVRDVHYPPHNSLQLVSARCDGARCPCRRLDEDSEQLEEGIPAGQVRFELRLDATMSAVWVEVEGRGVLYKDSETIGPTCAYVDLTPGQHQLTVRAEAGEDQQGALVGLTVTRYGSWIGSHWYRALRFVCGQAASPCTPDELASWAASQRRLPDGMSDRCARTKISHVRFGGTRPSQGAQVYRDVTVEARLEVEDAPPSSANAGELECSTPN